MQATQLVDLLTRMGRQIDTLPDRGELSDTKLLLQAMTQDAIAEARHGGGCRVCEARVPRRMS